MQALTPYMLSFAWVPQLIDVRLEPLLATLFEQRIRALPFAVDNAALITSTQQFTKGEARVF